MSPFNAWVLSKSLETLAVRVDRHCENALKLAQFLETKEQVNLVEYPFLKSHPKYDIAKKQMKERLFVITDAVTNTSTGPYPHTLKGDFYESNNVLSGSALNMAGCVKNLVNKAAIPLEEAFRMASLYPAQVMGLAHRSGRIEKGYNTALTGLSETLDVIDVID